MANWFTDYSCSRGLRAHAMEERTVGLFFYNLARSRPEVFKRMLRKGVRHELGNQYDIKHFTPQYNPWDQRLCLVPDSDLFKAIR